MAAARPLGVKSVNTLPSVHSVPGNKRRSNAGVPAIGVDKAESTRSSVRDLMQQFVRTWLITADDAQKQQLVDGVPGPFKHVALAFHSVSNLCGAGPLSINLAPHEQDVTVHLD
jgi:hypothetical protein